MPAKKKVQKLKNFIKGVKITDDLTVRTKRGLEKAIKKAAESRSPSFSKPIIDGIFKNLDQLVKQGLFTPDHVKLLLEKGYTSRVFSNLDTLLKYDLINRDHISFLIRKKKHRPITENLELLLKHNLLTGKDIRKIITDARDNEFIEYVIQHLDLFEKYGLSDALTHETIDELLDISDFVLEELEKDPSRVVIGKGILFGDHASKVIMRNKDILLKHGLLTPKHLKKIKWIERKKEEWIKRWKAGEDVEDDL